MSEMVWKEFGENALTHSAAHYLMTIKELLDDHGYARVTDVAKRLSITRGSCSISIKALKKRQWITEDVNKFLQLSEEGRRLAELVERNEELLIILLTNFLGVSKEQAEIDACKMEHLISMETTLKLCRLAECMESNPEILQNFRQFLAQKDITCTGNTLSCPVCGNICISAKH